MLWFCHITMLQVIKVSQLSRARKIWYFLILREKCHINTWILWINSILHLFYYKYLICLFKSWPDWQLLKNCTCMQIWAFTSHVFLPSSSVVCSQSFICTSGQRLSFQNKTGDLTKHGCDEITALWKTSHSHLYAAWMRSLPGYQLQPDILHLLPHCLLKMSEYESRLFIPFLPFSRFHSWNLRKLVKLIHSVRSLLHHSFNFVHIWDFLNFTVSQQRKSCKHKPDAGLVSRVSVTELSYLSSTAIMSFSPCFKKRKDSCSLCHLTISVL